ATALAATWDVDLVQRVGVELGSEARLKGAQVLLAPTVNIHRHPLAGRNFECFSEDPYLTGRMASSYIEGVQSEGVAACIKHFACNDSEFERFTISSEVPEVAWREIYLRPFEMAITTAHPWALMGAYNKLGGTWCCEHPGLLTSVLRDEWGFDGVVVSDWWGTHSTAEALHAGLDLEMPGPPVHRGPQLLVALQQGLATEAQVDTAVRRLLTAMQRTGRLRTPSPALEHERSGDTPERREVARQAARGAIVLLKNRPVGASRLLPLPDRGRIAVIGPNANSLNIMGGGSAAVSPYHATSALEGLRARFGNAEVVHEVGCSITPFPSHLDMRWVHTPSGEEGIECEVLACEDPSGPDVLNRTVLHRPVMTGESFPDRSRAARWRAVLTPPRSGRHLFQASAAGRFRVLIDDVVVVDAWDRADVGQPGRFSGDVELAEGRAHALRVEVGSGPRPAGMAGVFGGFELRCAPPGTSFEQAVEAAGRADVAVVVVGTNSDTETEGRDRKSMDLPGRQADLIRAVAAANPATVVVVNAGAPVTMDWADDVPAVLQSWFLGQETGAALADVLSGDFDAAGRLPTTIPRRLSDTPAHSSYPGRDGKVSYDEGLLVGYRWYDTRGVETAYPFGHGLSYTTFDITRVRAAPEGAGVQVSAEIANTGARHGSQVVQVYVRAARPRPGRPSKELKGFVKVELDAGETKQLSWVLDASAFTVWDPDVHGWTPLGGEWEILVATSAEEVAGAARVVL
ncbi:MAG: beta-glucosidase, partial [Acidimicrobiales bacterium]